MSLLTTCSTSPIQRVRVRVRFSLSAFRAPSCPEGADPDRYLTRTSPGTKGPRVGAGLQALPRASALLRPLAGAAVLALLPETAFLPPDGDEQHHGRTDDGKCDGQSRGTVKRRLRPWHLWHLELR
jgi:hypothetical protein